MARAIDAAFHDAAERLDVVRATLALLDRKDFIGDPRREVAWAGQKASVYVWLGACLETFLKSFLGLLLRDIGDAHVQYRDLKPELLSICGGASFDRLHEVRHLGKWRDRVAVLQRVLEPAEAEFPAAHLPLDKRTIEPRHLEIAWLVYGLPGDPFPGIVQKMALMDISVGRNKVAHGELKPEQLGRLKTIADLQRLVVHVEDVVQHVYIAGVDYVDSGGFRR